MSGFRLVALGAATVIMAATACSLTHAPSPSNTFEVNWKTQQPTRTSSEAELFLTDSGLWGYKPYDRDRLDDKLATGDLLVFESNDASHYFAVVETTRRGQLLQRLDDRPIAGDLVGHLRPLTTNSVDEHQGLCIADSKTDLHQRCGLSPHHRRWSLYGLSEAPQEMSQATPLNVIGDYDSPRRAFGLPVTRRAIAGVDALTTWVESPDEETLSAPVIAIESHPRIESTLRPTIAYDDGCHPVSPASSLVDAHRLGPDDLHLPAGPHTHPVTVENAAIRIGADTIATCEDDAPLLMIPVLSRPLLRDDRGRFIAPPPFGMRPRHLPDTPPAVHNAWARAAALVAVGDTSAAAFWIERALDERPDTDSVEEFALSSTSILASSGHPELAINIGVRLTDSAWDPRNIPDHLDGLIVLLGVLDQREGQRQLVEQRENLARRHFGDYRLAWHIWSDLRVELANRRSTYGRAYDELVDELQEENLSGWAAAIWATVAMHGGELPIVDDPDLLDSLFANLGAQTLWSRLKGDLQPADCSDDVPCIPTTYGWIPVDDSRDTAGALRVLAPNDISRGFDRDSLVHHATRLNDNWERTALWVDATALVPPADLRAVVAAAIQSLDEQLATEPDFICDEIDAWSTRFRGAAARTRLRPTDNTSRHTATFFDWWSATGLSALCAGPDEFLDALESGESELEEWTHLIMPILERQVRLQTDPDTALSTFRRTAEIAYRLNDGHSCTNWNLAIAVAATRSGRFEEAEAHLVDASACLDDDSELAPVYHVVSAYLDFERGAGHSILSDRRTERAIDRATNRRVDDPDTCVGLLPLDFRLDSQLPDSLVRIVDQLDLAPAPYDDFGLLTATSVMNRGRSAYLAGLRDLQRGQLHTAALALEDAQTTFSRLEHLPGLARIEFLDQIIYDGRLHELVDQLATESDDPSRVVSEFELNEHLPDELRRDFTSVGNDNPPPADDDLEAWIAAGLIGRQDEMLRDFAAQTSSLPPSLCDPDRARRVLHVAAERAVEADELDADGEAAEDE